MTENRVETGATTLAELLLWLQFQPHDVLQQKIHLRDNEGDWPWNGIIRFEGIDAIFTDEMTEEQSKALEAKRTAEETKRAADAYRRQTENLTEEERRLLP
jgi:hypothetical protein